MMFKYNDNEWLSLFSEVLKQDGRFKHSYNITTVGYWMCDMYEYQVQNLRYVYLFV